MIDQKVRDLNRRNLRLEAPVPAVLVIDKENKYNTPITSSLQPILLLCKNGSEITYQPKAAEIDISRGESGHAFAIIRGSDNKWYEVNNDKIINIDYWKDFLESYLNQYAPLIVYERLENSTISNTSVSPIPPELEKVNKIIEQAFKEAVTNSLGGCSISQLYSFLSNNQPKTNEEIYSFTEFQKAKLWSDIDDTDFFSFQQVCALLCEQYSSDSHNFSPNELFKNKLLNTKELWDKKITSYEGRCALATEKLKPF